jgi:hypothetical protein
MMDYMRNGGFNMWLLLATAVGVAAFAFTRPADRRSGVLQAGVIALLAEGLFGMATGMVAVASKYPLFAAAAPDRAYLVAQGLSELSNNGTFAGILGALLGAAAVVTARRAAPRAA